VIAGKSVYEQQIGDAGMGSVSAGGMSQVVPKMALEGEAADALAMIKAMIAAAKEGKPFCEQCLKAALAKLGSA